MLQPSCDAQALVAAASHFLRLPTCFAMSASSATTSTAAFDSLPDASRQAVLGALAVAQLGAPASELLVSDPEGPVVRVLQDFDGKRVGLIQGADRIEGCLESKGLLKRYTLPPSMVGVDVSNRGGGGVNALEVNLLASDICEVGWSWDACRHASCIEEKPGSSLIFDFNKRHFSETGLAPVVEGSLRFGSLSCSHTQQALRAIGAGCASPDPLMARNGHYCLEKLKARDSLYADAVQEGLRWKVLSWQVREMYPRVPDFIQAARNTQGTLNRKESEMQTLLRLHTMSSSFMLEKGGSPPWGAIMRSIIRTRPPCAGKLEHMITFVAARSGGPQGEFMQQLQVFHNIFVETSFRCGVPSKLYAALADLSHHFLALALLKTAWTCPPHAI